MDCKELKININKVKQNDVTGTFCNKSDTSELEIYSLFSVKIFICKFSVSKYFQEVQHGIFLAK